MPPTVTSAVTNVTGCYRLLPDSDGAPVAPSNQDPADLQLDPVTISKAESIGNVLQLEVSNSGGCGDHAFALFMSPATFAESDPVQASLWLQHRDKEDPCDGIVVQTLTFDLRPVAGLHQQLYGRKDRIQLNVHGHFQDQPGEALTVVWKPE